jgi:hypothetical protein
MAIVITPDVETGENSSGRDFCQIRHSLMQHSLMRHSLIQDMLRDIRGGCSLGLGFVPDQKLISWRISNNDRDGGLHGSSPAFSRKSLAAIVHRIIPSCCSSLESPVAQEGKSKGQQLSCHAKNLERSEGKEWERKDARPQGRKEDRNAKSNPLLYLSALRPRVLAPLRSNELHERSVEKRTREIQSEITPLWR